MATDEIEEGSTGTLTIEFFTTTDINGAPLPAPLPITPEHATYSITDITDPENLVEILGETTMTPLDDVMNIKLTSTQNRILDTGNRYEGRVVTVKWDWNGGLDEKVAEFRYLVKNMYGVI